MGCPITKSVVTELESLSGVRVVLDNKFVIQFELLESKLILLDGVVGLSVFT